MQISISNEMYLYILNVKKCCFHCMSILLRRKVLEIHIFLFSYKLIWKALWKIYDRYHQIIKHLSLINALNVSTFSATK